MIMWTFVSMWGHVVLPAMTLSFHKLIRTKQSLQVEPAGYQGTFKCYIPQTLVEPWENKYYKHLWECKIPVCLTSCQQLRVSYPDCKTADQFGVTLWVMRHFADQGRDLWGMFKGCLSLHRRQEGLEQSLGQGEWLYVTPLRTGLILRASLPQAPSARKDSRDVLRVEWGAFPQARAGCLTSLRNRASILLLSCEFSKQESRWLKISVDSLGLHGSLE